MHTFHRCNIRSIHYFLQKTHLHSNKRFLLQVQYLLELSHMLYPCPLIQTGKGDDRKEEKKKKKKLRLKSIWIGKKKKKSKTVGEEKMQGQKGK